MPRAGAKCKTGCAALDAVVEGTAVVESDPTGSSVGLGGRRTAMAK